MFLNHDHVKNQQIVSVAGKKGACGMSQTEKIASKHIPDPSEPISDPILYKNIIVLQDPDAIDMDTWPLMKLKVQYQE